MYGFQSVCLEGHTILALLARPIIAVTANNTRRTHPRARRSRRIPSARGVIRPRSFPATVSRVIVVAFARVAMFRARARIP
jgi:hypothetical protein